MAGSGGAGRGGGLLFVAVLVFVGYLALTAMEGLARLTVVALLAVAIVVLLGNVARRR